MIFRHKSEMVTPDAALAGRTDQTMPIPDAHFVLGTPLTAPWPAGTQTAVFGMGCFWGAERKFWELSGVFTTAVGYAGGHTPNPSYEEVCSGHTGHTEAVRVVFDPAMVSYADLVKVFFEVHDPTQGMRQGNDRGTQYRSAMYWTTPEQEKVAAELIAAYQPALTERGYGPITTEVRPFGNGVSDGVKTYYYAEDYHQQYLVKVPNGYRCHSATGVRFPGEG